MKRLKNEELRNLSVDQLLLKAEELRRSLFELRLNAARTHVGSLSSDQRKLKEAIARTLTHLRQKSAQ